MHYTSPEVYEFISKQTNDPIAEWRVCPRTGERFAIFSGDIRLLDLLSPTIGGVKFPLPKPTLSPRAREIRRLMWRNDTKLYRSTCSLTGKTLFSFYHPEAFYKIADTYRWTDQVDNTQLGKDVDLTRPIQEQFNELFAQTTKQHALIVGEMENSLYTHNAGWFKNCYMVFDGWMCEDVMYSVRVANSKKVVDGFEVIGSEQVYEGIWLLDCFRVFFSEDCQKCSDSAFLYNCRWCSNCILCSNLTNESYCIRNKSVTKVEYEQYRSFIFNGNSKSIASVSQEFQKQKNHTARVGLKMVNCEDSIGNNLTNCNNTILCEDSQWCMNTRYSQRMIAYAGNENNMDISSRWGNMNKCYELNCCGTDQNTTASGLLFGSYLFWWVSDSCYTVNVPFNVKNVIASTDIANKQYCILNKQYSKEEYGELAPKVIQHMMRTGEWWEFFSPQYAPFPYNDSIANDYYPIKYLVHKNGERELVNSEGHGEVQILEDWVIARATLSLWGSMIIPIKRRTENAEVSISGNMSSIDASDITDSIYECEDSICDKAILCLESKRPFRITKQELLFYKNYGLPLPRLHPDIRYQKRIKNAIKTQYSLRACSKTHKEIISVYPQETPYDVLSEDAYKTFL